MPLRAGARYQRLDARQASIADHAPREKRGAAMGLFYGLTGFTTFIASLAAGMVWDRFGATPALLMGAAFAILALLAFLLVGNRILAPKGE